MQTTSVRATPAPAATLHRTILATLLACALLAGPAAAGSVDLDMTDGVVRAIALSPAKDVLYVGGEFSRIGPPSGGWVPFDAATGQPVEPYARVAGGDAHGVRAAVADGSGGWYLGGMFQGAGGQRRRGLMHLLANGAVDAWNPDPDFAVYALARAGNTLYVGGYFVSIGGVSRSNIAAIDLTTGGVTPWDPQSNGPILALAADGGTVYAGGQFTTIGGTSRNTVAALDAGTGLATAWNPNVTGNPVKVGVLLVRPDRVVLGGTFTAVGGVSRIALAAVNRTTGAVIPTFDAPASRPPEPPPAHYPPEVQALATDGTRLFVGGFFDSLSHVVRGGIGAVSLATGALDSWYPAADGVRAIALSGSIVYLGGSFSTVGGQSHRFLAAVDATSGVATSWQPPWLDLYVYCFGLDGSRVFAGGDFSMMGGVERRGLAAIDLATGKATGWDPKPARTSTPYGAIEALVAVGDDVFVGGMFDSLGGARRINLGSVDRVSGLARPFNPRPNDRVYCLLADSTRLYAGGSFTVVNNSIARKAFAAWSLADGTFQPLVPAVSSMNFAGPEVDALCLDGTTLYVGGGFNLVGGQSRLCLGAINVATNQTLAWDPHANYSAWSLAAHAGVVYAGGIFTNVGGQTRYDLAAIDATTGAVLPWAPNPEGSVNALLALNGMVFVTGNFNQIAGSRRTSLAALDPESGALLAWPTELSGVGYDLVRDGNTLYVGGGFHAIGAQSQGGGAAVDITSIVAVESPMLTMPPFAPARPNPVRDVTTLVFRLAAPGHARLVVLDPAGRLVRTLWDAPAAAGEHRATWDAKSASNRRVPPGIYYGVLETGGARSRTKIVVLE